MLVNYLPKRTYAIVSGYAEGRIVALVAGCRIGEEDLLDLAFPKVNPFQPGDKVTLHLDNRTGADYYDQNLLVYRTSVKGTVLSATGSGIRVRPAEYEMVYSSNVVERYLAPEYRYPPDERPLRPLENSSIEPGVDFGERDFENKLGVLISAAPERPHTTVMAFLSSVLDDIFIISHEGTLKSRNLARDPACVFAIDHRADYHFEKAYDWNYTLVRGTARTIPRDSAAFGEIQAEFVRKNPWEQVFFTDPKVIMYHIEPLEILCPEKYQSRRK